MDDLMTWGALQDHLSLDDQDLMTPIQRKVDWIIVQDGMSSLVFRIRL
jgi:hypothetical protein